MRDDGRSIESGLDIFIHGETLSGQLDGNSDERNFHIFSNGLEVEESIYTKGFGFKAAK
jgi:hypothetical protein